MTTKAIEVMAYVCLGLDSVSIVLRMVLAIGGWYPVCSEDVDYECIHIFQCARPLSPPKATVPLLPVTQEHPVLNPPRVHRTVEAEGHKPQKYVPIIDLSLCSPIDLA